MKKIRVSILMVAILCIFVCFGGCADNHYDASPTLLTQSDEVEATEKTTEKEHSQPEADNLQNYYQMWCDGEITADEFMNKPGVMDSFIKGIKATTGYDLYNESFTWTYVENDDRYPFKFTVTDEDGIGSKGIEAIIISYKDGAEEEVKYALEVNPNIYDPATLNIIEYN